MFDSVGERLKKARKHSGMTQVELAKAIDAKQGAISDLENGRNNSSTKLVQMAICTGVSAEWLSTGKGEMAITDGNEFTVQAIMPSQMVPVFSYVQAKDAHNRNAGIVSSKFEPVKGEHSNSIYWIKIEDSSMTPEFKPKELVLINPELTPNPGDYIVALEKNAKKIVFRKWRLRGFDEATNQKYSQLVSNNPDFPIIDSRHTSFEVCGVAIEHRIKLR